MKHKLLFVPLLFFIGIMQSAAQITCNDVSEPSFTCYPYPSLPNGVAFFVTTDFNYTVSQVFWDFGDGQTSTQYNPYNSYATPGSYNVCVSVTYVIGELTCVKTYCNTISCADTPCNQPNLEIIVTNSTEFDYLFSVSGNVLEITSVEWTFGDGTSASGNNMPHTYASAGVYQVCAFVVFSPNSASETCTRTICTTVNVNQGLNCIITPGIGVELNGLTATITSNSIIFNGQIIFNSWYIGESNFSGEQFNYTFPSDGEYTICLNTLGIDIMGTECFANTCTTVVINKCANLMADFTFINNDPKVSFTALANLAGGFITTYEWNFGNGEFSNQKNPVYKYPAPGNYTVCLKVRGYIDGEVCEKTICKPLTILSQCGALKARFECTGGNPIFVTNNSVFPGGNITGWSWDWGDGNTSNLYSPGQHTYAARDGYPVCLTMFGEINGEQCVDEDCDICGDDCDALEVKFKFTKDQNTGEYSFIDESTFLNGTITEWKIDYDDGTPPIFSNVPITFLHTFAQPGIYMVCLSVTGTDFWGNTCKRVYCQLIHEFGPALPVPCCDFLNIDFRKTENANGTLNFQPILNYPVGSTFEWSSKGAIFSTNENPSNISASVVSDTVCLKVKTTGVAFCEKSFCKIFKQAKNCDEIFMDFAITETTENTLFRTILGGKESFITNLTWNFGNNQFGSGFTSQVNYNNLNNYNITLTATCLTEDLDSCYKVLTKPRFPCSNFVSTEKVNNSFFAFELYPNPTSDEFIIQFASAGVRKIEILDIQGRLLNVELTLATSYRANAGTLPKGLYLVRVTEVNSNQTKTQKLIIH